MNYYYITGTSRGIGKAFVEYLLHDGSNFVVGISRKTTVTHKNYKHVTLDLSDVNAVKDFRFEKHPYAKRICLINNAGAIDAIKPLGKLESENIIRDYNINLIAPTLLMNNFISMYSDAEVERIIVNVSSGAGKNPVAGWGTYCASKTSLDMISRVIDVEQKTGAKKGIRIFSIGPGVVDTDMQVQIRSSLPEDFPRLNDFINYKASNQLASPDAIAKKYFTMLDNLDKIKDVVVSAKDY